MATFPQSLSNNQTNHDDNDFQPISAAFFDEYMKHLSDIWSQSERSFGSLSRYSTPSSFFSQVEKEIQQQHKQMQDEIRRMLDVNFSEKEEEDEREDAPIEDEVLVLAPARTRALVSPLQVLESLSQEEHNVEVTHHRHPLTGEPNMASLIHAITDWGYLTLRFPGLSQEMGVSLDLLGTGRPSESTFSINRRTNLFGEEEGVATIRGVSKVANIPVRVKATVNLHTFRGRGIVERDRDNNNNNNRESSSESDSTHRRQAITHRYRSHHFTNNHNDHNNNRSNDSHNRQRIFVWRVTS